MVTFEILTEEGDGTVVPMRPVLYTRVVTVLSTK